MQNELNCMVDVDWLEKNREWYRAIWIECAEAIDHHGWKWWKKQTPDMDQVKMELVDIWHFILSWVIQDGNVDIVEAMSDPMVTGILIENIETMAMYSTGRDIDGTVFAFSNALSCAEMTITDLYAMYAGKYTLNAFRQDNGYKDGTYRKTWSDGREDNEHLIEILPHVSLGEDFEADVYAGLKVRYER
jgi:dimeric dUTPase (all-alpha-NTP-PPase superfamily)